MEITKAELRAKYESMRPVDLAQELGIGTARLYRLLDKAGIERKRAPRPRNVVKLVD